MHFKDARASGETEQRLYSLDAWRETPFYSGRERAALAWTEAVTLLTEGFVADCTLRILHPTHQVAFSLLRTADYSRSHPRAFRDQPGDNAPLAS
jgi:alkylhydroperoxidase family enzyme